MLLKCSGLGRVRLGMEQPAQEKVAARPAVEERRRASETPPSEPSAARRVQGSVPWSPSAPKLTLPRENFTLARAVH